MNKLLFKLGISLLIFIILWVFNHLAYFNIVFLPEAVIALFYLTLLLLFKFSVLTTSLTGLGFLALSFLVMLLKNERTADSFANASYFLIWTAFIQWVLTYLKNARLNLITNNEIEKIKIYLKKIMPFLILIVLILLPRLFLAINFFGTLDSAVGIELMNVFSQGKDVYMQGGYAYPPLWLFILLFLKFISVVLSIPFYILIRFPAITADVLLSLLIFQVFKKRGKPVKIAFLSTLLFALNPVSILVSGYHGQVDGVWILFALLSWYVLEYYQNNLKNLFLSAFLLSLGMALKVFPILFLPLFLIKLRGKKNRMIFMLIAILPLAVSLLIPLITSFSGIYTNFVNYSLEHNFWGIGSVVAFIYYHFFTNRSIRLLYGLLTTPQWERILLYGFLLFLYAYLFVKRNDWTIPQGMFLVVLSVLLFTPFFSVQWWVWVVPLAVISASNYKRLIYYSLLTTFLLISRYYLYLGYIAEELRPIRIIRDTIKGIKIDSVNKIIAFGVWLMLWKWFIEQLRVIARSVATWQSQTKVNSNKLRDSSPPDGGSE